MAVPHIVIAGCGFGGLTAAYRLRRRLGEKARITAIDSSDRFDYHASLPGLVSGRCRLEDITAPLGPALGRKGIAFIQGRIARIDYQKRQVVLDPVGGNTGAPSPPPARSGRSSKAARSSARRQAPPRAVPYDHLILALGSKTAFYGIPGAQEHAFEFKSYHDALALRGHVQSLLSSCPLGMAKDDGHARIVVVGGGLTGVELAADLQDLVEAFGRRCGLPPGRAELVLVNHDAQLHPTLSAGAGRFSEAYLRRRGIRLVLGNGAKEVLPGGVRLSDGTLIRSKTVIWCAGVSPSDTLRPPGDAGFDARCGLVLNPYLQSIGDKRVWAVGDCASCSAIEARPVLTYLRAVEQADFVVHNLSCELSGRPQSKMEYVPRPTPALISLGKGMGLLSYGGLWSSGGRWLAIKSLFERIHLARYRNGWDGLEFADQVLVALVELMCYVEAIGK